MTHATDKHWATWAQQSPDHLRRLITEYADGHAIYDPAVLEDLGLPVVLHPSLIQTHTSGPTFKDMIFTSAGPTEYVIGVYALTIVQSACRALTGCTHRRAFGRGTPARLCAAALTDWLTPTTPAVESTDAPAH